MRHHRSFLALLVVFTVVMHVRAEQPLATSTIVVYNKSAPDSPELARFYAKQRGIAPDHIIGLTCSVDEEITREEYDGNIAEPLREAFKSRKWWTIRETAEHHDVALLLVCRLDAPSVATVRQMIIDSVAAEKTGLWGRAYVDSSHGPSTGY